MPVDGYDGQEGYCKQLGHAVPFRYCRSQREGRPCGQLLNCWFERIPVEEYVRKHLAGEEVQALLAPPHSKLATLVELIHQAQNRTEKS